MDTQPISHLHSSDNHDHQALSNLMQSQLVQQIAVRGNNKTEEGGGGGGRRPDADEEGGRGGPAPPPDQQSPKIGRVPSYMQTDKDFFVIFKWAKVDEDSVPYALVIVFILSVLGTVVTLILKQFEKEVLRRNKITAGLRLGAALAFTVRMGFCYLFIVSLFAQNLWLFMCLLGGHFVGWVIFSGMNSTRSTPTAAQNQRPSSRGGHGKKDKNFMIETPASSLSTIDDHGQAATNQQRNNKKNDGSEIDEDDSDFESV